MGLPAALVAIGPYMGLNFTIYEYLKAKLPPTLGTADSQSNRDGAPSRGLFQHHLWAFLRSGLCGAVSGGMSKLLVYPCDTVKKRLQYQVCTGSFDGLASTNTQSSRTTAMQCMRQIYAQEGIRGFYKGIVPTALKAVMTTAIMFATFEVCVCSLFSY